MSPAQFMLGLEGPGGGVGRALGQRVRGLPLSRLRDAGLFDSAGHPTGVVWEDITLPCAITGEAYAVRVDTDVMEPLLRAGSSLVVMPDIPPRRSDRVLLVRHDREPLIGILVEESAAREGRSDREGSLLSSQAAGDVGPINARGTMRWAVLPYRRAGQEDGPENSGARVVPVEDGKAGVVLHRIIMATS